VAKKLLIVLVVLAALAGGGIWFALNKLDVIAHYAIEHYGPEITGVTVKVKDVELSPTDGKGALRGVDIGSPRGFNAARTARLGEIRVAVDPATVTQDLVVIREIAVVAPEINYEKGSAGTNLDAIQKNIERYLQKTGTSTDEKSAGPKGPGRRYVIEKLSIRGARVTMTNPGLKGQGITFTLPDIQLANLGKRPDGITAGQAANIVTNALISRIAQRLLTNIDLLRKGGTEGALDALKGLLK
jgi:uncharacterized protein involved in outer membrane biogenesis